MGSHGMKKDEKEKRKYGFMVAARKKDNIMRLSHLEKCIWKVAAWFETVYTSIE